MSSSFLDTLLNLTRAVETLSERLRAQESRKRGKYNTTKKSGQGDAPALINEELPIKTIVSVGKSPRLEFLPKASGSRSGGGKQLHMDGLSMKPGNAFPTKAKEAQTFSRNDTPASPGVISPRTDIATEAFEKTVLTSGPWVSVKEDFPTATLSYQSPTTLPSCTIKRAPYGQCQHFELSYQCPLSVHYFNTYNAKKDTGIGGNESELLDFDTTLLDSTFNTYTQL